MGSLQQLSLKGQGVNTSGFVGLLQPVAYSSVWRGGGNIYNPLKNAKTNLAHMLWFAGLCPKHTALGQRDTSTEPDEKSRLEFHQFRVRSYFLNQPPPFLELTVNSY